MLASLEQELSLPWFVHHAVRVPARKCRRMHQPTRAPPHRCALYSPSLHSCGRNHVLSGYASPGLQ
jgi:hypothetical protein